MVERLGWTVQRSTVVDESFTPPEGIMEDAPCCVSPQIGLSVAVRADLEFSLSY